MKLIILISFLWVLTTEAFSVIEETKNFSQLVNGVSEVIDNVFSKFSETANFMSIDQRKLTSHIIKDFRAALMMKVFKSSQVVFRQEMTSTELSLRNRRRRATVFIIERLEDFVAQHKFITSEFFRFNGLFLIVHVNGTISAIEEIFKLMWKIQIYNVIVMVEKDNQALVFTFFPFNGLKCEDTTPVLINSIFTKWNNSKWNAKLLS